MSLIDTSPTTMVPNVACLETDVEGIILSLPAYVQPTIPQPLIDAGITETPRYEYANGNLYVVDVTQVQLTAALAGLVAGKAPATAPLVIARAAQVAQEALAAPLTKQDIGTLVKSSDLEVAEWVQTHAVGTIAALPTVPVSSLTIKEGQPSLTLVGSTVTSQSDAVYALDCHVEVSNTSAILRGRNTSVFVQTSIFVDGILQDVVKCPVRFSRRATLPNAIAVSNKKLTVNLPTGSVLSTSCVLMQDELAASAQLTTAAVITMQLTEL